MAAQQRAAETNLKPVKWIYVCPGSIRTGTTSPAIMEPSRLENNLATIKINAGRGAARNQKAIQAHAS
jgi:hypothetical protein